MRTYTLAQIESAMRAALPRVKGENMQPITVTTAIVLVLNELEKR